MERRTCTSLYMHNDYMPIRGVQGRIHIYNARVEGGGGEGGRKRGKIVGDGTITGIDEQPARGIGSARVIDLANLPLRTARC